MLRFEIDTTRTGYLHATLSGVFQIDSAKDVYRAILQAAAAQGLTKILMDCRRILGEMSTEDRLEFGTFMATAQAWLAGLRMRASESLDELRSWLGV